jgi:putative transposase
MSQWPHSLSHIFNAATTYMVTAATLYKQHFFKDEEQLDYLQSSLLEICLKYNWRLEAWAIFSNHYHFIAQSPSDPTTLRKLISHLHTQTARQLNQQEHTPGRRI